MTIVISEEIEDKLRIKHQVTEKEVQEALANCTGNLLTENSTVQIHRRIG